jgi:hypothetical protein
MANADGTTLRCQMGTRLVVFKEKQIRQTLNKDAWWFSVADTVKTLTDSADPKVSIPRQSRGLYDCWPLKGAVSQSEKLKPENSVMLSSGKNGLGAHSSHLRVTSYSEVTIVTQTSIKATKKYSRNCQTLGVARQSRGFTHD